MDVYQRWFTQNKHLFCVNKGLFCVNKGLFCVNKPLFTQGIIRVYESFMVVDGFAKRYPRVWINECERTEHEFRRLGT